MNEIVKRIVEKGYEAYIVGGYVRDYLLGLTSTDIDICTNASIDTINKLFKGRGKVFKEYSITLWGERRGWDSNPRTGNRPKAFRVLPLGPLEYLCEYQKSDISIRKKERTRRSQNYSQFIVQYL